MIFYILLLALIGALSGTFLLQMRSSSPIPTAPPDRLQVNIGDQPYSLEIAATPLARQKGLMYRKNLEANSGMLFIFDGVGIQSFWMKNTFIPLDMIWLNEQKEIVYIKENAQPCENVVQAICQSIVPLKPALYVIELNAGDVQKLNLKVGDKIDFEI